MFPNIPIPVIGLTGPSGAGKSAAAAMLRQMGCAVLDGDALARKITERGSPVCAALAVRFGADILDASGALRRGLLAERAFASQDARAALNRLTHPAITALAAEMAAALPTDTLAVIIDAAALPESDIIKACDHIIIVTAPEEVRLQRVLARDGIGQAAARQRLEAQRGIDYEAWAGHKIGTVVENNGAVEEMRPALEGVLRQYGANARKGE